MAVSTTDHSQRSSSNVHASTSVQQQTQHPGERRKEDVASRTKDDPFLTKVIYGLLSWAYRVPLEGQSQGDWLRLCRSGADMSGLRGAAPRKDISMEEVRRHRTKEDAWMVLQGKVYNITRYLKFHPGGAEILAKVAGKDGTSLFMKYHPHVAADALMQQCLVGRLAVDPHQALVAAEIARMQEERRVLTANSSRASEKLPTAQQHGGQQECQQQQQQGAHQEEQHQQVHEGEACSITASPKSPASIASRMAQRSESGAMAA